MNDENQEGELPPPPNVQRSVMMFIVTLCSVYLVYGFQWAGGNPLTDVTIAWESVQFAIALMTILLCHELGHYFVAKKHGFELSVPYFLPFPFAFGTLGAVIHLKSLPKSRTALLEMGAAGPIAGFIVTTLCIVFDAGRTQNHLQVQLSGSKEEYIETINSLSEPSQLESVFNILLGITPPNVETVSLMIMEDPLLMRGLNWMVLTEPLSPFAELGPIAFAGWVGCLITSINLLPIGQLDGGHIMNAFFPEQARGISKGLLAAVFVFGIMTWKGWMVWATLLWFMRANEPIWVPRQSTFTVRSKVIGIISIVVFGLCVMAQPIYDVQVPVSEIQWIDDSMSEDRQKPEVESLED